ncbi:hypothetical protein [Streptomyces sp. NBC_00343]|uniref:hypothetical protein n=1 Tax=Streptomyces sp. NBC_00343 TaxID=2975719 RepID=UPI002E2D87E5|nr:hypothetical protein [Streptomyces sp. NBC_00343]
MTTPHAATAVVRAALEDATVRELLNRPGATAWRIIRALETDGWTIMSTPDADGPETGIQSAH